MSIPFLDFITLRGFNPKHTDALFPVLDRAPRNKKIAFLSISATWIRTASIHLSPKGVIISESESMAIQAGADPIHHILYEEIGKKTNCSSVIVEYGDLDSLDIAQNVRRATPQAEVIAAAHDAKSILGGDAKPTHRYAILPNPASTYGYVGQMESPKIETLCSDLSENKRLSILRFQCSALSLSSVILAHPEVISGRAAVLIADHGNLIFLKAEDRQWPVPRVQPQVLVREDERRQNSINEMVAAAGDVPLLVIDTKTSLPIDPTWLPGANFSPFEKYESENLPIYAALADHTDPEGLQVVPTVLRGLAHDIGLVPPEPSFLLPPQMKLAAYLFWILVAANISGFAYFHWKGDNAKKHIGQNAITTPSIDIEIQNAKVAMATLQNRQDTARILNMWLQENASLQPLVVQLVSPFGENVQVSQFGITRMTDSPSATHKLRIVFSAEAYATNKLLKAFSPAAEKAGWSLRPTNQSVNAGNITFEAALSPLPSNR